MDSPAEKHAEVNLSSSVRVWLVFRYEECSQLTRKPPLVNVLEITVIDWLL
jgi:hypothetical protein